MKIHPPLVSIALGALVLTGAVWSLRCERGAHEFRKERGRAIDLEDQRSVLLAQNTVSEAVVGQILSGELSLDAALVELEAINRSRLDVLRVAIAGQIGDVTISEREALAWFALSRARLRYREAPTAVPRAVLDRFEDEYRVLFERPAPGRALSPTDPLRDLPVPDQEVTQTGDRVSNARNVPRRTDCPAAYDPLE